MSNRVFSHPAKLAKLTSLLLVIAATACGAWSFAAAQENAPSTTRYVRNPAGALFAWPTQHSLSARAAVRTQDSSSPAPGPWIYTVAGDEVAGYSGDGGPATAADLNDPFSVIADSRGNLYIADSSNNVVRKVAAGTGIISTFAGTGTAGYSGDNGPATSAELNSPQGLALDKTGNLFIADSSNNVVREVSATTGVITTIAGTGLGNFSGDNGPATIATLYTPLGLAFDAAGNLYIADYSNFRIREVAASTGIVITVAGNGTTNNSGDGALAINAGIGWPAGMAVDPAGDIYISDNGNHVVRKVTASSGLISTVAGNGTWGFAGDGGPATAAEFRGNSGLALDSAGDLLVADTVNDVVRAISATTGNISSVVGWMCSPTTGDGGSAACSNLMQPQGISVDSAGNLYITTTENVVREVPASTVPPTSTTAEPTFNAAAGTYSGTQTVVIGSATPGAAIYITFDGSTPTTFSHMYNGPFQATGSVTIQAIALAPSYLASAPVTAAYTITTPPTAVMSTVAGNGIAGFEGANGPATSAELRVGSSFAYYSEGIVLDSANNLYFSDPGNSVVWMVAAKTGIITVFAGDATAGYGGDGGLATSAQLSAPSGLAMDAAGDIYISDVVSNVVRKVTASTGVISTIAGIGPKGQAASGQQNFGDGGPATSAVLDQPMGLAVDGSGNLYIADSEHNLVRMVSAATGNISTVAGGSTNGQTGDGGLAVDATVWNPTSLALDSASNLYISQDIFGLVRKVTAATGIISTVAGSGSSTLNYGDGGLAIKAGLYPAGVAVDSAGNLYIDSWQDEICKVSASTGIITRVAGNNYIGYSGDDGSATVAELHSPTGLAIDASGSLYFADAGNDVIRKVTFPPPAATPTFTVAAGIFQTAQTVSILDSLQGATIYFTTDGSTPTTASEVFTTPITISATTTLQAIAVVSGYSESAVTSGLYTIQVTPTITWGTPAAISYGTPLSNTQLDATSSVAGTFAYTPALGSILTEGAQTLKVTFTPTDATNYTNATATVTLTVNQATPTIQWSTPAAISYGTTLGNVLNAAALNDSTAVAGSFAYTATPSGGAAAAVTASTIPLVGSYTLTTIFTPTDTTDYTTATASVSLTVNQATPTITWATPANIPYGTALSAAQLNATTPVAGSFAYTPALGTVLPVGMQTLKATFTPTDTTDYTTATASVQLSVGLATPTLALTSSANPAYVSNSVTFTATLTSTAGTPTGTANFYDGTTKLGTGTLAAGVATFATSSLTSGAHSITAVYSGDADFAALTSTALTETIEDFTFAPPASGSSSATASAGGQAIYQLSFGAVGGTTGAQPITLSVTGLPTGATATFSPASIPANSPPTNVTLTVTLPSQSASRQTQIPFGRAAFPVALGLLLLPFAGKLRRAERRWSKLACFLLLTLAGASMAVGITGCGGGGGSNSGSTTPVTQTYTLTVSATAGADVHTTTLTLIVN